MSGDYIEPRLLRYFAVVAEEASLRKAAERLFVSQPPLSRQIRQLEETLGVTLFTRHNKGLTLTDEGRAALDAIRPFLDMQDKTMDRLRRIPKAADRPARIGLTTAYEQGTFAHLEARLHDAFAARPRVVRASSPKLVSEIRKGRLDAAFVALPLDAPGLMSRPTGYAEPLVAALPQAWVQATAKTLRLADCSGSPLFWFRRESNPAFFEYTRSVFAFAKFEPVFIEEPAEHDVYLARIAAGEGMGLLAESFAAIKREGVVFRRLAETESLRLELGVIGPNTSRDVLEKIARLFEPHAAGEIRE